MTTIDLRSDTVTKPTAAMLQAMMTAPVGDDVYGEDESVNALEAKVAQQFGMEAALFCPSGTMTNQIALRIHTQPQEEVICDYMSHIYHYEAGGIAANSHLSARLIHSPSGKFTAQAVLDNINPDDIHYARTALVSLENTVNKGGGCFYTLSEIAPISEAARANGLAMHLDGARIFNALVASGDKAEDYGKHFDTLSVCFSKGLGAPVGSALVGSHALIKKAKKVRKLFGGGMRQAGFLAAAAAYALDHHISRLAQDHQKAAHIAQALASLPYVAEVVPVYTNIVIFKLIDSISPQAFSLVLKEQGILANPFGKQSIRMVTHLDFDEAMMERLLEVLKKLRP